MSQPPVPSFILLLEDDDLDAELIATRLARESVSLPVARAKSAAAYRQLLAQPGVALILSDFHLPAYDGLEALEDARALAPAAPFLFVSGAIGEERAIETMRRGATDYVQKDRLDRLVPAVKRALAEAETRMLRAHAEAERDRLLVSERQAREAAEAASRLKDEFLAIVSHELRTPLHAIVGWASVLMMSKGDPEKQRRGLEAILRNARIQTRIVDDILDVSRIVRGTLELRRAEVGLGSVIRAAVDSIRPTATAKGIEVLVELEEEGIKVFVDAERVHQVVWNLLSNAVKFTDAGGRTVVSARRRDDAVTIEVTDTGAGIEAGFLPHVFEPFRQGDGSKSRTQQGLGLGLAIVRSIVELHGGQVNAASEGRGRGATFRVRLPFDEGRPGATASAAPVRRESEVSSPLGAPAAETGGGLLEGLRILVVDDEADARDVVGEMLRFEGASVRVSSSVRGALDVVATFTPDVVISDIGMPEEDGYTLLPKLRNLMGPERATPAAIALTGFVRDVDKKDAERAGYLRHVAKPVARETLLATVAEVSGRPFPR